MNHQNANQAPDFSASPAWGRRDFLRYGIGSFAMVSMGSIGLGCGGSDSAATPVPKPYLIDPVVKTTAERMISFRYDLTGLAINQIDNISKFDDFGYGDWTYVEPGLPVEPRKDLMGDTYTFPAHSKKLLNFFTFSDIHITDKEAPNQLMLLQNFERYAVNNTSIYSPVMMYTTHVLDAAMQTMNALHKKNPFDFGLSLGDTCNSTSYNELRWYMDVMDGKVIRPSSGAHMGEDTIDYQKPYQAVGLDKSIPWYQTLGNHDHFMIGSFPVDAVPSRGLRESYVADTIWAVGDVLIPNIPNFPVMIDVGKFKTPPPLYYMGVIDGSTPLGNVIYTGLTTGPAFAKGAPKVVADPDRRSLMRTEWIGEFFKTDSSPVGHGLNLVDKAAPAGFACYSFVPKSDVPLKIIVLDDTQSENDGSADIHGHGFLDATRWTWLKAELAAGQTANQLMVIAAHAPIGVGAIGSELEWWLNDTQMASATATQPYWWLNETAVPAAYRNAVSLTELVSTLQATPNLVMWIAGHRHLNSVKAFKAPAGQPLENGFWQVETSSLRDFPQQLRTFEIYLNSDYTVSVVAINVDPAVAPGTPAATSRGYAVAVQQIVKTDLQQSAPNPATMNGVPLPTVDPTRSQAGDAGNSNDPALVPDPTIKFNAVAGVPYTGSYNAELYKPLSPAMVAVLKARFPQTA